MKKQEQQQEQQEQEKQQQEDKIDILSLEFMCIYIFKIFFIDLKATRRKSGSKNQKESKKD